MSDPLPLGKKTPSVKKKQGVQTIKSVRNNKILFIALLLTVFGLVARLFDSQSTYRALAYTGSESTKSAIQVKSPLFEEENQLFDEKQDEKKALNEAKFEYREQKEVIDGSNELFAQKIYALVGDAPIREMVPYISQRDDKVAAFLIGIAKKESSFGQASPSKDGKTCYNYWGYKGSAGRGTGMGYACFASAEEAVNTVGNRIEVLVGKNRSTPAKMVDTWKCGTTCKGDPGAPSWVSTVALYFDELVDQNI